MKRDPLVTLPPALIVPGAATDAGFVMGVDGGATKTLAAVLDMRDEVLYLGHGGSSNPDSVGAHAATDALLKATDEALARAGLATRPEGPRLDAAVLAIAGTDTNAVAAHVCSRATESWIVVNDVVGAWATATGAKPGAAVISGTGSNAFGVGADGSTWRAGGWGHLLGDEGSGYQIAVQSIRAALRDRECSGPETELSDAAVRFFGVQSIEALASLVYARPLSKGEIAAFAAETARVAHGGDVVARGLYERAAVELGAQVSAVIRQTGLSGAFPVGLIGSAFKAGSIFVEPLAASIHEVAPEAQVSVVELAPVGGCLLLAARAAGCEGAVDRAELERLIDGALIEDGVDRE